MNGLSKDNLERKRVWEIDALRGLLILAVLINHLNLTVHAFCINGHYNIDSAVWAQMSDPLGVWYTYNADGVLQSTRWVTVLRELCTYPAVSTFFVVSGICCAFSRKSFVRGIRLLAAAFIFSGFTKLIVVLSGDADQFIRFGVLHCYAYCHLVYHFLLEKRSSKTLLLIAVPVFLIGYYLRYHPVYSEYALLVPFGIYENGVSMRDYWPILPMLGWMLVGVVLGRRFYKNKESLLPNCGRLQKWTRPLQWMGRYSGQIYLAHIFVYTAVFCGIGWIFGLL